MLAGFFISSRAAPRALRHVIALAFVLLIPFVSAAALSDTVQSSRYTVGQSALHEEMGQPVFLLCGDLGLTRDVRVEGIGGQCDFRVRPGDMARVSVVDDVFGADVGFSAMPLASVGEGALDFCADGVHATGSTALLIPNGCSGLAVLVDLGGTIGTITVIT